MKIANAHLWVHDQEEALAFYTEKLGMEIRADVSLPEMGDFRWLTVSPPGQDDCQADYEALRARGVEFSETPEERPYGIDAGFRDPSGNSIRLTEVKLPATA